MHEFTYCMHAVYFLFLLYVCMYVCVYVPMCVRTYANVCTCAYVRTYIHMGACVHVSMYVCTYVHSLVVCGFFLLEHHHVKSSRSVCSVYLPLFVKGSFATGFA